MRNNPLVSILIPMFNHEEYILECLESIDNITYDNIEVILCDDGSSDNTLEIAESWAKESNLELIKILKQDNVGVCKTLNRMILNSNGTYISICASDDSLTQDSFCERVDFLENNKDKYACIGDALLIDDNSKLISNSAMRFLYKANTNKLHSNIVDELVFRWSVIGPTLLIRRDAYDILGLYDEEMKIEDRDFYLRLLSIDGLVYVDTIIARYRIHSSNTSRKSIDSRLLISKEVAKSNLKNQHKFHGVKKFFLQSHHVDLYIIKIKPDIISFIFLSIFKCTRRLFLKW